MATKKKPTPDKKPDMQLNRVGALWVHVGRNGKFMSGIIELAEGQQIRLMVFKNGFKEQAKHPDYVIYEKGVDDPLAEDGSITDDDVPL